MRKTGPRAMLHSLPRSDCCMHCCCLYTSYHAFSQYALLFFLVDLRSHGKKDLLQLKTLPPSLSQTSSAVCICVSDASPDYREVVHVTQCEIVFSGCLWLVCIHVVCIVAKLASCVRCLHEQNLIGCLLCLFPVQLARRQLMHTVCNSVICPCL